MRAGARPGALVAIAYPRSVEYLVAIWAVAKTGAGFLSIDPSQPVARVQEIIDRAAPVTGVSAADFHSVGANWTSVTGDELDQVEVPVAPLDSVAYVVY